MFARVHVQCIEPNNDTKIGQQYDLINLNVQPMFVAVFLSQVQSQCAREHGGDRPVRGDARRGRRRVQVLLRPVGPKL